MLREAISAFEALEVACDEEEIRSAMLSALPLKHVLPAIAEALPEARERLRSLKAERIAREKIEQQASQDDSERVCVVCCDRERAVAFVPCGHRALCRECADRMVSHESGSEGLSCPVCRSVSSGMLRVYG